MALRLGDAVYVHANGFSDNEENLTEAHVIRRDKDRKETHVWIVLTSNIPTKGLWGAFKMRVYHSNDKTPFAPGMNYDEYNFEGDKLFYSVPIGSIYKLNSPPVRGDDLIRLDNELEVSKKLNLKEKEKHRNYVIAFSKYLKRFQTNTDPVEIENNIEEENPQNLQNLQGGFRRKSRKQKRNQKKKKSTRKH
jgi:hypothetical protein